MILTNKTRIKAFFSKLIDKRGDIYVIPYSGARKIRVGLDKSLWPGFGKELRGTHSFTGSKIELVYKAKNPPTKAQIQKAKYSVRTLKIPREHYTGRITSARRHNGNIYINCSAILERDREDNRFDRNFRNFDVAGIQRVRVEEKIGVVPPGGTRGRIYRIIKKKAVVGRETKINEID